MASGIDILQVNVGYRCNQTCKHCHVQAGPDRQEVMSRDTIEAVLSVLREGRIRTLDITGGAPELNPCFKALVEEATAMGCHTIARSNLTMFFEQGMDDLFDLYDRHEVEIIASLPYYLEEHVDRVRGTGVFEKSITAIRRLNSLGYGFRDTKRQLNLVYNPQGAFLPPPQATLQEEYKKKLQEHFGIFFNCLYTFANMPIGRFRQFLKRTGNYDKYRGRLETSFNPDTLTGLMCRRMVSVGWDGSLYDCDFNQMLELGISEGYPRHITEFDHERLSSRKIVVGDHCFGCTAGQGST